MMDRNLSDTIRSVNEMVMVCKQVLDDLTEKRVVAYEFGSVEYQAACSDVTRAINILDELYTLSASLNSK
jgi:hypothetical protein